MVWLLIVDGCGCWGCCGGNCNRCCWYCFHGVRTGGGWTQLSLSKRETICGVIESIVVAINIVVALFNPTQ